MRSPRRGASGNRTDVHSRGRVTPVMSDICPILGSSTDLRGGSGRRTTWGGVVTVTVAERQLTERLSTPETDMTVWGWPEATLLVLDVISRDGRGPRWFLPVPV